MTVHQLIKACSDAIARGSSSVTFVLPGYSRGRTRRLLGRHGPRGEVVADTGTDERPESLVAFDPVRVLAYLTATGLVTVQIERTGGTSSDGLTDDGSRVLPGGG